MNSTKNLKFNENLVMTDRLEITRRFSKQGLEDLFSKLGSTIRRPVEGYLLGGGAMAFRDQKATTKDIDVIVQMRKEAKEIAFALKKLDYIKARNLESEYEAMNAQGGIWQAKGRVRVDLFVNKVCNCLSLTQNMRKRSIKLGDYGKLSVFLVSNEDVILFKGITQRPDDANDIASIVRSASISWDAVLKECISQSKERAWFGPLLDKIEELKTRDIAVPIEQQLVRLDEERAIREAFKRRLKKMTAKQAVRELKQIGFTQKELEKAGIKP